MEWLLESGAVMYIYIITIITISLSFQTLPHASDLPCECRPLVLGQPIGIVA
jgi:hypothetical protein